MAKKLLHFIITGLVIVTLVLPNVVVLAKDGGGDDERDVRVIVHTDKPYDDVEDEIEAAGGVVTIKYENVDAVAATIPAESLGMLLALPGVVRVEKDRIVELPPAPEESLQATAIDMEGVSFLDQAQALELAGATPETYYSYQSDATAARDTWAETGFGSDSLIAIIDTGTSPDGICLPSSAVIAGPDFAAAFLGDPVVGSTNPQNHWHGTFVGNVAASRCSIFLPSADPLASILMTHLPADAYSNVPGGLVVPLQGISPLASIYAVKVFPSSGAGVPSSIIEAALDHVITVKKSGAFDIDVVNMSLGGPALYDGNTLEEQLVDAATEAGITVVAAAGNDGPAPNSVSTPGSAFTALTAGASSDPVHTRIAWDAIFGPGQGDAMYPADEIRPADFSSRGPTADDRSGPDITATGVLNFAMFTPPFCGGPDFCLGWASGTSFSTPTIAGGAALLNAWTENNNPAMGPLAIRNALIRGATPLASEWTAQEQGRGYLNVRQALDLLISGEVKNKLRLPEAELEPNVEFDDDDDDEQTFRSRIRDLGPARTVDFVFEITEETSLVEIELTNVSIDPNPVPAAFPNSIEFYVKSAKRGGSPYVVDSANVFGDASVAIGDGFVNLSGPIFPFSLNEWPMEPGLMKVTIEGDWTNNGNVDATITIRRFENKPEVEVSQRRILDQGIEFIPVTLPGGGAEAVFELGWEHNWSKYPTNDLDFFLFDPFGAFVLDFSGASLNSPEQIVVANPEGGIWTVAVVGFDVFTDEDSYFVDVRLDGVSIFDEDDEAEHEDDEVEVEDHEAEDDD